MYDNKEILAGWKLTFDEVSNNIYNVTLTDTFGRIVETTNSDFKEAITTVESYAFNIQKKGSGSWNKFLYDSCIIKLANRKIVEKRYDYEVFGSWYILLIKNRILLDGRDSLLSVQTYKNDWIDIKTIKLSDLTYDSFLAVINLAE